MTILQDTYMGPDSSQMVQIFDPYNSLVDLILLGTIMGSQFILKVTSIYLSIYIYGIYIR